MFDFLAKALAFFYGVWPSYGGAIVLFTLAIMAVLSPLSIKSARSMIRMQRLSPELKRLQQEYKNDREGLQRETMALYQANQVNPFASCLPLLLQMPVFIVLYRVLHGLTTKGPDGHFRPKYLDPSSSLAVALRGSTKMMSAGLDLSRGALQELTDVGVIRALPYFVLVALVVFTQWYQQRQIAGRNQGGPVNPQQQMISKVIPFVFIPVTLSIASGVVVYFLVSNLVRIGQQAIVTKLEFGGGADNAVVVPPPTTPAAPNGKAKTPPTRPSSGRVTTSTPRSAASRKRRRK
jgi:YidC/Oxa1 family membrane protein insertase